MINKVAIITLYYNSLNCGGNLQAYALEAYLNKKGFLAEQLTYKYQDFQKEKLNLRFRLKNKSLSDIFRWFIRRVKRKRHNGYFCSVIKERKDAFIYFNHNFIKHSNEIYDDQTIEKALNEYDEFICGSDQVWNLNWYKPALFLNFVQNKNKFSYAASISMQAFTEAQASIVKSNLKDFSDISVRESNDVKLLETLTKRKIELVLDPTLLLDKNDWINISAERLIDEEYIFCYFLGINMDARKLAKQFAKKYNKKLVYVPFANGEFLVEDLNFGDIEIIDASPQKFLSLINYASYIFTDSFHAVIFSKIFEKEYVVFNRNKNGEMNSRIKNITSIFKTEERFCDSKKKLNINYIESLDKIDYTKKDDEFLALKNNSEEFLMRNLT